MEVAARRVPADGPGLRRSISLPGLVLYGLGTTIGAGIYALTGVAAGRAGLLAPSAFLLPSALAVFTAFSFAELSARFPRAGGEAVYVLEGLRSRGLATLVGVLMVLAGIISAATVCVGFVGYLGAFIPVWRLPTLAFVVFCMGAVAARGMRESVVVAGVMTLIETGGLLAVIVAGREHLGAVPERLTDLVPLDWTSWRMVGSTSVLCFYAFLGFEDMVNVAEEVRDVRRTLPRAILTVIAVTALLYGLLTTVAVLAVPPAELAASEAPIALVFERCGGSGAVLGVVALFALLNGALIQIVKASRVLYGLAREGALPAALGRIHPRTRTPLLATALSTAMAALLAMSFPLAVLAESTSIITLGGFALANASLVVVKLRDPIPEGIRTWPLGIPIVGFTISLGFGVMGVVQRLGAG